jgi:endonuclease G
MTRRQMPQRAIGPDDSEPAHRIAAEVIADDAVALIQIGAKRATGFLVAADRLMTNHHVLPDPATAQRAVVRFGYRATADGKLREGAVATLHPRGYFKTSEPLDYTVIGISTPGEISPLDARSGASVALGESVTVVGHPRGGPMKFATQDAEVVRIDPPTLGYRADTQSSSSGSPVFDSRWRLVALHHRSAPVGRDDRGNEGILMTCIAEDWS